MLVLAWKLGARGEWTLDIVVDLRDGHERIEARAHCWGPELDDVCLREAEKGGKRQGRECENSDGIHLA